MADIPEFQDAVNHWICKDAGVYWDEFQILARVSDWKDALRKDGES